jgi:hypothetical protein
LFPSPGFDGLPPIFARLQEETPVLGEQAVQNMKQVMRRDPDNTKCQIVIKRMRKLEKTKKRGNDLFKNRDWNGAIPPQKSTGAA